MTTPARRKIAILGGGIGALTAAYELTEMPNWQEQYDITVYQMGWRLGGKGASGRNRKVFDRIEEHGLHLWFGYYENAFHLIRRCYEALGRSPDQPLATWQEAFHKQSLFVTGEFHGGAWTMWPLMAPETDEAPGDGKVPPLAELLDRILEFLHRHFEAHAPEALRAAANARPPQGTWLAQLVDGLALDVAHLATSVVPLHIARALLRLVTGTTTAATAIDTPHDHLLGCLEAFITHVRDAIAATIGGVIEHEIEKHPDLRRLLEILELGYVNLKGMLEDDVLTKGFDPLDRYDYREWMAHHGGSSIAVDGDLVRVAYETIFAYRGGFFGSPDLGAGTAARGLMRLCFAYKGAIGWEMQAGMGDTIFAPLYLVLKQRGVRFEFFSKVKNLGRSPDGKAIQTITLAQQATPKQDYDPLYDVNDLPCWPSEPFYDQLVQGPALEQQRIDLESKWSPWKDVAERTLVCGSDFTDVVLGISIGALPDVCPELLVVPAWQQMVRDVKTTPTQAFQLWLVPDLAALGWDVKVKDQLVPPVLGGYAQPQNTWADMSHLIDREAWPSGQRPGAISYFCGPFEEDSAFQPLPNDYAYPLEKSTRVMERALQWLTSNAGSIWPRSTGRGYPGGFRDVFDLTQLVDHSAMVGGPPVRFQAQYWRANVEPSERYVLSVRGSLFSRLPPGASGFSNLFLAGDWTRNGLNYGCIEAAVMSGRQAARAITGQPLEVFGES